LRFFERKDKVDGNEDEDDDDLDDDDDGDDMLSEQLAM